ncbi:MAG: hypothetical protein JNL38_22555 [Myxococcales bacterium]|nr:hypothetical protein [Myxococcales bacterium]
MTLDRIDRGRDRTLDEPRGDHVRPRALERARDHELDPAALAYSPARGKDLAAFVQNVKAKGAVGKAEASPGAPRGDERILFVGMNGGDQKEAPVLGSAAILAKHEPSVTEGGRIYDLGDPAEAKRYFQALGLPPAQAERVASIVSSSEAKGELASIARAWAPAETGRGDIPARLVLSGHSTGSSIYGPERRHLELAEVRDLGRAMPKAAALVEGIHFSACSSAKHLAKERPLWSATFPGLKGMWGYDGGCPPSPTGHIAAWAAATRPGKSTLDGRFANASTAVWTPASGFVTKEPHAANAPAALRRFDDWVAGRLDPSVRANKALLEPDRRSMQWFASRAPAHDEIVADRKAQFLLALEHYGTYARSFATDHRTALVAGYAALGMRPPPFETMPRREALASIARFQELAQKAPSPDVQRCSMLLARFVYLDTKLVNDTGF